MRYASWIWVAWLGSGCIALTDFDRDPRAADDGGVLDGGGADGFSADGGIDEDAPSREDGAVDGSPDAPPAEVGVGIDSPPRLVEGAPARLSVGLLARPTAAVEITVEADAQLLVDGGATTTLTFTPDDWEGVEVSIEAALDTVREADHEGLLTFTATSDDARYQAFPIEDLALPITDRAPVVLVSATPTGAAGNAASADGSALPVGFSIASGSADGRYVAFASASTDLVEGTGAAGVFLRDLDARETLRLSSTPDGGVPNGPSGCASISEDGSRVVFHSTATNLVPSTPAGLWVYLWERGAALRRLPIQPQAGCARLSGDGRFVVYVGMATGFDIFRYAIAEGTEVIVSVAANGSAGVEHGNGANSFGGVPSRDGRYVGFFSFGNFAGLPQVPRSVAIGHPFVKDLQTGALLPLSAHDDDGTPCLATTTWANYEPFNTGDAYPAAGGAVAFHQSRCALRVANAEQANPSLPNRAQVYVRRLDGGTERAVFAADGVSPLDGEASLGGVSSDGRYAAWSSPAANAVGGDTNGVADVFATDTLTNENVRLSMTHAWAQTSEPVVGAPEISADGRFVLFRTVEALVPEDTNGAVDLYRVAIPAWTRTAPRDCHAVRRGQLAAGEPVADTDATMDFDGPGPVRALPLHCGDMSGRPRPYVDVTPSRNESWSRYLCAACQLHIRRWERLGLVVQRAGTALTFRVDLRDRRFSEQIGTDASGENAACIMPSGCETFGVPGGGFFEGSNSWLSASGCNQNMPFARGVGSLEGTPFRFPASTPARFGIVGESFDPVIEMPATLDAARKELTMVFRAACGRYGVTDFDTDPFVTLELE